MRAADIEVLLPQVYRRTVQSGSPLAALLAVMEHLHAPTEAVLADVAATIDPHRAPDAFVPFLAGWVDLDRLLEPGSVTQEFAAGTGRLRQLVAFAAVLARRRGTARGLAEMLALATGLEGIVVDDTPLDDEGRPRPFHVVVTVPADAAGLVDLVRRIVEQEKPAHVTSEVRLAAADADAPGHVPAGGEPGDGGRAEGNPP